MIFAYWNEVRRGRLAPRRFDIEPARIAGILAETMILEQTRPAHLPVPARRHPHHRALRPRVARPQLPRPVAGRRPRTDRSLIEQIADQGGACRIEFRAIAADGEAAELEAMLMPLVHTHGEVDRFLGSISATTAPSWLGVASIAGFALDHAEMIWPDGKPGALRRRLGKQAPLIAMPQPAASSGQRRQFRVLDGGRQDIDRSER